MQSITYNARRSVISGHTAGLDYTLNLPLTDKDRSPKAERTQQKSLGGDVYTTFNNLKVSWECKTRPLTLTELKSFREFLDSAADGQLMQFDPEGWAGASPSHARAVILESNNYREKRIQAGATEASHRFEISFTLTEV